MKLKRILAALLALALLLAAAGCTELDSNGNPIGSSQSSQTTKTQNELFDEALMEDFREVLGESIVDVHFTLRNPATYGLENAPKVLGSIDFDRLDNPEKEYREAVEELDDFDRAELNDEYRLIYDLLVYESNLQEEGLKFSYYEENLSPLLGQQAQLPSLLAEYRLDSIQDAHDYVELLGSLPDYFEDLMEYQRRRSQKGLFMSDAVADKTIASCQSFIDSGDKTNQLVITFETRLNTLGEQVTAQQKTELLEAATAAVRDKVLPAYRSMIDGLTALKGTGKNEGGLCNLPDGKAYYEYCIKNDTGTVRSMDMIIDLLDSSLEDEIAKMFDILQTDEGAFERYAEYEAALTDPEQILTLLQERTKTMVPPLSELSYDIKYVDPSMEEHSSPAFYFIPPIDDSVNSIYINRADIDSYPTLFSLLGHEGYPGHMYQNNYVLQQNQHPFRSLLSYKGYSEGWASYVEQLCYALADINDPAVETLMAVDNNLSLIVSARIDVGVNYEGWDKAAVAEYLANVGLNEAAAEGIYATVIEESANYPAYCIGQLEFAELRELAEDELGDSFDEIAFHKVILDLGEVPFAFVRHAVEQYILENVSGNSRSLAAA